MQQVLVTGGAGYLGCVLCARLLDVGYRVRCVDALHFGDDPLRDLRTRHGFELIQLRTDSLEFEARLLEGCCGIIHLAGPADDASFELDPLAGARESFDETIRLARLALTAGVRRFVVASSCAVYGMGGSPLLDEDADTAPASSYAAAKLRMERALLELGGHGLEPVVLRPATLFGVSPRMRFDLAVNRMSMEAKLHGRVRIHGGGEQWRPFLHVDDAARGFVAALRAPAEVVAGHVFNLGSDSENYRIRDVARLVAEAVPGVEPSDSQGARDARSYHVSFRKIRTRLDWSPRLTVADGVREIVRAVEAGGFPDPDSPRYNNARMLCGRALRPAIEGGTPVRAVPLAFSVPSIGPAEEQEVLDVLRSGWLTTGDRARRFEERLREYTGAHAVVAVNSCTAALHLSLIAAGVGPGDEVITSPITWPSTANVIVHCGATPVFADIEAQTLNLDPALVERSIGPRTRAIIPVHMAGLAADLDRLHEIARRRGLVLIEDAAHALGSEWRGARIGALSRFTCFSFYPIKNITTGEGGAIALRNPEDEARLRSLALHGITRDAWDRYRRAGSIHWECVEAGFKYNLPDLAAAIGIHQLARLDSFIELRSRFAARYHAAFGDLAELELPAGAPPGGRHAHHLYIVRIVPQRLRVDRDGFAAALRAEGISTGIHFRGLHLQPYYRSRFRIDPAALPVASAVSERVLSLPLYPALGDDGVEQVIAAVRKIVTHYRRS